METDKDMALYIDRILWGSVQAISVTSFLRVGPIDTTRIYFMSVGCIFLPFIFFFRQHTIATHLSQVKLLGYPFKKISIF